MSNPAKIPQTRCTYVLPKKSRSCRMLTREGQKYCGEHAIFGEDNEDRIPCPNDPKHTVDRRSLPQHLLRCNSRVIEEQWIVKDMNALVGETKFTAKIDRRANEQEISSVIEKLQSHCSAIHHQLLIDQSHCEEIDKYLEQFSSLSDSKRKHLIQQSSIIGHMKRVCLLRNDPSACTIELGAGKAQLAYWMSKEAPLSKFLLVDRSGARNKYDNRALQENPSLNMKRLRCSIEHLNLAQVEMLKVVSNLSAVCKHFCGSATDAGIRCLSNGMENGLALDGFVLVPCCHHKSRYSEYCGREFLAQWNMDSEGDFAALRHIATWAVCGFTKEQAAQETQTFDPPIDRYISETVVDNRGVERDEHWMENESVLPDQEMSDTMWSPWSPLWKEEMGRRAKAVLEFGRLHHLASLGFSSQVIEYVPKSVSPENLLILGFRQKIT